MTQVLEEFSFTNGRVIVRGQLSARGEARGEARINRSAGQPYHSSIASEAPNNISLRWPERLKEKCQPLCIGQVSQRHPSWRAYNQ